MIKKYREILPAGKGRIELIREVMWNEPVIFETKEMNAIYIPNRKRIIKSFWVE